MQYLRQFFKKYLKPKLGRMPFVNSTKEMLVSLGELTLGNDFIVLENYPFEPSVAFKQAHFVREQIKEIDYNSHPPSLRIGEELIYISVEKREELKAFAHRNAIKCVERHMIWEWILEPFLDTELDEETDQKLHAYLIKHGLGVEEIIALREEVSKQMYKYNFLTGLWEWMGFGHVDVLKAMRANLNREQFTEFYKRSMRIALLPKKATF